MTITLELARGVRRLLRRGWCQRASAQDANGRPVYSRDPTAAAWSLDAAMSVAAEELKARYHPLEVWGAVRYVCALLRRHNHTENLITWNDARGRRHEDILSMLDRIVLIVEREVLEERAY